MGDYLSFASFPNCLECFDEFRIDNDHKVFKTKRRLININIDKEFNFENHKSSLLSEWGPALSPLLLDSTIFSPLYEPSLQQHDILDKKPGDIKRVLCLKLSGTDSITTRLSLMLSTDDVVITTHMFDGKVHILIGWFDCDLIKNDFVLLQKTFGTSKLVSEMFFVTKYHSIFQSLCGVRSLQIFLNNLESIYLFSTSFKTYLPEVQTPITNLIEKFGKLSFIDFDASLGCYKCTFTNIKSAFTICKFHHFNTRDFEFYACHTLTEVESLRLKLHHYSSNKNSQKQSQSPTNKRKETFDLKDIPLKRKSSSIILKKIHSGEDKRSTLLIKNIPKNMKYQKLRQLIDTISCGRYISLHFKSNPICSQNFGYAFITFKLPVYIIDFYSHFHNRKWKGFHSSKTCHLVYAKEQDIHVVV